MDLLSSLLLDGDLPANPVDVTEILALYAPSVSIAGSLDNVLVTGGYAPSVPLLATHDASVPVLAAYSPSIAIAATYDTTITAGGSP